MKTKNKTAVIFRTFLSGGDVMAMFPFEPSDNAGYNCQSYQHIGQHGSASADFCRNRNTRPSTPAEIDDLSRELRGLGYDLDCRTRIPRNALAVRRAALTDACA